jgi:hypothetical protein
LFHAASVKESDVDVHCGEVGLFETIGDVGMESSNVSADGQVTLKRVEVHGVGKYRAVAESAEHEQFAIYAKLEIEIKKKLSKSPQM